MLQCESHPACITSADVPDHICPLAHQELVAQRKSPIPGSYFDAGCLRWTVQAVAPDPRAGGIKTPRCEGANQPRNRAQDRVPQSEIPSLEADA
jgi:hypothetical protein